MFIDTLAFYIKEVLLVAVMMCIYASRIRTVGVFCDLKLPNATRKEMPLSLIPRFHMEDHVFKQFKSLRMKNNYIIV